MDQRVRPVNHQLLLLLSANRPTPRHSGLPCPASRRKHLRDMEIATEANEIIAALQDNLANRQIAHRHESSNS